MELAPERALLQPWPAANLVARLRPLGCLDEGLAKVIMASNPAREALECLLIPAWHGQDLGRLEIDAGETTCGRCRLRSINGGILVGQHHTPAPAMNRIEPPGLPVDVVEQVQEARIGEVQVAFEAPKRIEIEHG